MLVTLKTRNEKKVSSSSFFFELERRGKLTRTKSYDGDGSSLLLSESLENDGG